MFAGPCFGDLTPSEPSTAIVLDAPTPSPFHLSSQDSHPKLDIVYNTYTQQDPTLPSDLDAKMEDDMISQQHPLVHETPYSGGPIQDKYLLIPTSDVSQTPVTRTDHVFDVSSPPQTGPFPFKLQNSPSELNSVSMPSVSLLSSYSSDVPMDCDAMHPPALSVFEVDAKEKDNTCENFPLSLNIPSETSQDSFHVPSQLLHSGHMFTKSFNATNDQSTLLSNTLKDTASLTPQPLISNLHETHHHGSNFSASSVPVNSPSSTAGYLVLLPSRPCDASVQQPFSPMHTFSIIMPDTTSQRTNEPHNVEYDTTESPFPEISSPHDLSTSLPSSSPPYPLSSPPLASSQSSEFSELPESGGIGFESNTSSSDNYTVDLYPMFVPSEASKSTPRLDGTENTPSNPSSPEPSQLNALPASSPPPSSSPAKLFSSSPLASSQSSESPDQSKIEKCGDESNEVWDAEVGMGSAIDQYSLYRHSSSLSLMSDPQEVFASSPPRSPNPILHAPEIEDAHLSAHYPHLKATDIKGPVPQSEYLPGAPTQEERQKLVLSSPSGTVLSAGGDEGLGVTCKLSPVSTNKRKHDGSDSTPPGSYRSPPLREDVVNAQSPDVKPLVSGREVDTSNILELSHLKTSILPPTPKRPTVAFQKLQHKKLTKPFRSPVMRRPLAVPTSKSSQSDPVSGSQMPSPPGQAKAPETTHVPSSSTDPVFNAKRHRTQRASSQFKSPLSAIASSNVVSTVRLTPTIQALERKLQILKRAVKVKQDGEEETLERLVKKWTEAGREVAWEVWGLVKDIGGGESASNGGGGWGKDEWEGKGKGIKRGFEDSWGWSDGEGKKPKVDENERNWGWNVTPNRPGEDDRSRDESENENEKMNEDDYEERKEDTLGTMLKQLGIAPETLGWDEDEGTFVGE